jgi:hypothetical protein
MRIMARLLLVLFVTACTSAPRPVEKQRAEKQRGMSFASGPSIGERNYGTVSSAAALRRLEEMGVNWISIMPFGWTRENELRWSGTRSWENDDALRGVTKQAHELGIKVLLKPHLWGNGTPAMADYARFIEHYATLAQEMNVDAFSIGNEQKRTSRQFESEWRDVIARVRAIYKGPITYGANWDEIHDVPFWDALDWIGVSAYFPLADARSPSREELTRGWQPIVAQLAALSAKHGKPIVFTEIGYRSADGAAWRQWEIPRDAPVNTDAQRLAYEVFFDVVWPQPWLAGAYPWKWFSYPNHGRANDYEFEGKPAEEVIQQRYGTAGARDRPPPR